MFVFPPFSIHTFNIQTLLFVVLEKRQHTHRLVTSFFFFFVLFAPSETVDVPRVCVLWSGNVIEYLSGVVMIVMMTCVDNSQKMLVGE